MSLTFRNLAVATCTICFALAGVWLLAPHLLLDAWGIDYSYPAGLVSRRAAALFFGVGLMFFLARKSSSFESQQPLSAGLAAACLALAGLGVFELLSGHAGAGILSAVSVELAIAALFIAFIRRERANLRTSA